MNTRSLLSLSLTLILLVGCVPQALGTNQPAGQTGTQNSAQAQNQSRNQASSATQAGLEGDITSVYEDEADFSDTIVFER